MTQFVKFTENNEWEGEEWHFWIPLDGNEDALARLQKALDGSDEYSLDLTPVPEGEVDVLIKHTDQGYMDYHNKLTGTLRLSEDDFANLHGDDGDIFYKGRIANFVGML